MKVTISRDGKLFSADVELSESKPTQEADTSKQSSTANGQSQSQSNGYSFGDFFNGFN